MSGYSEVYPRVCGGTFVRHAIKLVTRGLSPRVRGNRFDLGIRHGGIRSIPACAGEPETCQSCPNVHEVYPRVCGGTTARWRSFFTP